MGIRNNIGLVTAPILAGVEQLWKAIGNGLTINGQTVEPTFWFDHTGLDDTAKTWTCRKTGTVLSETGVGTSPDLASKTPFLGEVGAGFAAGKYLQAANNTFGDITTEDFIVLFAMRAVVETTTPMSKYTAAAYNEMQVNVGGEVRWYVKGADGTQSLSVNMVGGNCLNALIYDASDSAVLYHNAAAGTPADVSGVGNLTAAGPFTIGARSEGSVKTNVQVNFVALFKKSAWLDTHLQPTMVSNLTSIYNGSKALHNHGSLVPSVGGSRTVAAYSQRCVDFGTGERQLFYHGANGLRLDYIKDDTTGLLLPMHLREPQRINLAIYNRALNSWATKTGTTVPTTDATAPDGSATADVVHEDGGNSRHLVQSGATPALASGTTYCMSGFLQEMGRRYLEIAIAAGGGNPGIILDAHTATLISLDGTASAGGVIDTHIDNWVYAWLRFTSNSTGGVVYRVECDDDNAGWHAGYAGADIDSFRAWGFQIEAGQYPSSLILNDGATAVTRTADAASVYDLVHRPDDEAFFQILDTDSVVSSVANLPAPLTINGSTEYPVFRYKGEDATTSAWSKWTYGEDLSIAGAGADVTPNQGSPLLGSVDDSVLFNAGKYYQASGNSFGDITTEDFVIEVVFKVVNETKAIASKLAAAPIGWECIAAGLGIRIQFYVSGWVSPTSANLTEGSWYHGVCFVDRSGSAQWYINGVASGSPVDVSGQSASIAAAAPLTFGDRSVGGLAGNQHISYFAMWKKAAWLDTHLQADVAKERFSKLLGIYPQKALGTATPEVITRATCAYLDKYEADGYRHLYYVGDNWLRMCSRKDDNGDDFIGYLAETNATNLALRSETVDHADWTKSNCSVTDTSTDTLPTGATTSNDVLHENDAAATTHFIADNSAAALTNGVTYTLSVWAKAINRDWLTMSLLGGAANSYAWFDLGSGVVGTKGALVPTTGIEDWGNGWYRCWMTGVGTGAQKTIYLIIGEADNDMSFDGLDQDSIYCWGVQVEQGNYPSSYTPTTSAAVTRNKDQLRYKGGDGNVANNLIGTIKADILKQRSGDYYPNVVSLSDGGSAAERINGWITNLDATPNIWLSLKAGDVIQAVVEGTTNLADNVIKQLKWTWKPDNARVYVDGSVEGTPDTDCDIPDDLDRIHVGVYVNDTSYQLNGLVRNIRIYPKFGVE